ncbi:hypothetical protein ACT3SZ_06420 [Corynebacterium sp. AOP40-9SA-29]|uniref:hypothetical protein n=1 Tax=Corynebacterium sp. AOP40-9SA-29 TaxID=3457677 RepID=UPI004034F33A
MPEPELVDLPARHLAVVRDTVAVEELAAFYDRAFPQIFTALDAASVVASDAPMAVTHGVPAMLPGGNYDLLADAFAQVISWAQSQGLTPTGTSWEQYLTEPTPDGDPDANETLIGVLVR